MHFLIIWLTILIAFLVRLISCLPQINYQKKWGYSLFFFAFPPLIILMTSIVIISMGYHGEMWGMKPSKISYGLAWFFFIFALISLINLAIKLYQTIKNIQQYEEVNLQEKSARLIDISVPYAAQIGFWQSELVISKGLFKLLSPEHLTAVISHENAHQKHKDPFFFFWLSWLEKIAFWLPNNKFLWQNLLLMRELRADNTASQEIDFLLLAESLLIVTESLVKQNKIIDNDFVCPLINYRLQERIDALISSQDFYSKFNWYQLAWLVFVFLPWITIPYHNSM